MANLLAHHCLLLLAFLPTITIATSHNHQQALKTMHFSLYEHDIFNTTDFIIVSGAPGVGPNISQVAAPFGSITVLKDNLTLTPNPSSKVVGTVEAVAIISSFDGLSSVGISSIALNLEDGHSGTISTLGVGNAYKASDYPIVGGTGDFLFVQGFLNVSPVSIKGFNLVYKLDFHLVWPPYATYAFTT